MAMLKATSSAALVSLLILMALARECFANDLRAGFYVGKCGTNNAEAIAFRVVKTEFIKDRTIVAALLRLHFHDCFVRGCDASILLDGPNSEKEAGPNGSVRGYEVIDAVKTALEKACPGVVSCADIIVIATRVAVNLAGGRWYGVQTGRRDGTISLADDASEELVGPSTPISTAIEVFASKGINIEDFVLLLGAHTTGVTRCAFVESRLYNFDGVSGKTDPSMNPRLIPFLKRTCPRDGDGDTPVNFDQSKRGNKANKIDNGFFRAIMAHRGVLEIDQMLALDASTRRFVSKYAASEKLFQIKFGQAMVKLGGIDVLTGNQGEVRKSCRLVN